MQGPRARAFALLLALLALSGPVLAQTSLLLPAPASRLLLCPSEQLAFVKQLSFAQRACWYGSALASPGAALRAGFTSGFGQWINHPFIRHQDADDLTHRFEVYYAKRAAQQTAELIAASLNHEDPRFRPSGESTFKKRIRSAALSVLVTEGDEGGRLAVAPIAGSLASAFTGTALYRQHTGPEYALRGAAIAYSTNFANAIYREFRPDLSLLINRMLHNRRN